MVQKARLARAFCFSGAIATGDINHTRIPIPRDELAGDALGGLFRLLGRMLVEPVFELPIKGVGDGVLRVLRPRHEPSETATTVASLLTWIMAILAAAGRWQALAS